MRLKTSLKYADLEYVCAQSLSAGNIAHGFFGRKGGVSKSPYDTLNIGSRNNERSELLNENKKRIIETLSPQKPDEHTLVMVRQCHGTDCVIIDTDYTAHEPLQADACVTKTPGYALTILTADCAPILLAGKTHDGGPIIGAIHAGWRGAFHGVIQNTLKAMKEQGLEDLSNLQCAIGPCIHQKSYQVSNDYYQMFMDEEQTYKAFFVKEERKSSYLFDLSGFISSVLVQNGLKQDQIEVIDHDTYQNPDLYFSHRYATHKDLIDTGRQASAIMIKP